MTRLIAASSLVALLLSGRAAAQAAPDWRAWDMLAGEWIADEGHGQPGAATSGSFSFAFDLDRRVLVRRDHSEYAATSGRPATRHDGLMIIYAERPDRFAATSFDNEGHVIEYAVEIASPTRIVFTSPARDGQPRYRLTYDAIAGGLKIAFAIAPPNQPEAFAVYVEGTAHRVRRP
jgi:hypothetical protein